MDTTPSSNITHLTSNFRTSNVTVQTETTEHNGEHLTVTGLHDNGEVSENAEMTSDNVPTSNSLPSAKKMQFEEATNDEAITVVVDVTNNTKLSNDNTSIETVQSSANGTNSTEQPTPPRRGAMSTLSWLIRKTDAFQAVGQFQNKQYLESERSPEHLFAFRQSVVALRDAFRNDAMSQHCKKELSGLADNLVHQMDRLRGGKPIAPQVAMRMLFSLASIGLCVIPLMTARKSDDNQYLSLLVAGYAKTMFMLAGLLISSTADAASLKNHIWERHVPYAIPIAPYAVSAYAVSAKKFENEHAVAFHGMAFAFTATCFILSSAPHLVTAPLQNIHRMIMGCFTGKTALTDAPEQLETDLATEIGALTNVFREQHAALQQRRAQFEDSGNQLSDALSTQVSDIVSAAQNLDSALTKLLGHDLATDNNANANPGNPDYWAKQSFTVTAGILCACSAVTYYNEPVGLIDLSTDTGLTVAELMKTASNPTDTMQRASEKFSSYSGLAPLLLIYGVINKITATPFTDSVMGLSVGSALLACGNLTMPRPMGEVLAKMLVKLIVSLKESRGEGAQTNSERIELETIDASDRIVEIDKADHDKRDGMGAPV